MERKILPFARDVERQIRVRGHLDLICRDVVGGNLKIVSLATPGARPIIAECVSGKAGINNRILAPELIVVINQGSTFDEIANRLTQEINELYPETIGRPLNFYENIEAYRNKTPTLSVCGLKNKAF